MNGSAHLVRPHSLALFVPLFEVDKNLFVKRSPPPEIFATRAVFDAGEYCTETQVFHYIAPVAAGEFILPGGGDVAAVATFR